VRHAMPEPQTVKIHRRTTMPKYSGVLTFFDGVDMLREDSMQPALAEGGQTFGEAIEEDENAYRGVRVLVANPVTFLVEGTER